MGLLGYYYVMHLQHSSPLLLVILYIMRLVLALVAERGGSMFWFLVVCLFVGLLSASAKLDIGVELQ